METQQPTQQSPSTNEPPVNPSFTPEQPTTRPGWQRWLWLVVGAALVVIVSSALMWLRVHHAKPTNTQSSQTTQPVNAKRLGDSLCFVRLGRLVCTDASGQSRQRYDLPSIKGRAITYLHPDATQSLFVAYADAMSASDEPAIGLLDGKLKLTKTLALPTKLRLGARPTIAPDGLSLLLELDGSSNDRELYRYTLASGKLTQLTNKPYNMTPQQTQGGRVLYAHMSGSSWTPFVMQNDGSSKRSFTAGGLSFGYDVVSDQVFLGTSVGADFAVAYGSVDDFLKPDTPQAVAISGLAEMQTSTATFHYLDNNKLLVSDGGSNAVVVDLAAKAVLARIAQAGQAVGTLSTAGFTPSTQQTELKYERIKGLDAAPADLQAFLKPLFDSFDAKCDPGHQLGLEAFMTIQKVVKSAFALVGQGCEGGAAYYYVKTNGAWQEVLVTQELPTCSVVNEYKMPKELVPECYDLTANAVVSNTNN